MRFPTLLSIPALLIAIVSHSQSFAQPTPPYRSPVVAEDGSVTFRIRAPKAKEVKLKGKLSKLAGAATKDDKGVWTIQTKPPEKPDIYTYAFSVDGVHTLDSQNTWVKYWITTDNLVEIPGKTPTPYAKRDVPHGTVQVVRYRSKSLGGVERRMHVYTPPGYEDETKTTYPVLYLHHGFGDNDSLWTLLGRAHFTLDNAIADGEAVPMIVVMPYGHASYKGRPKPKDRFQSSVYNMHAVADDLLKDIIPLVEKRYRVRKDRLSRAVAGLSMGGGQSFHVGLNYTDKFAWIGAFSAAVYAEDYAKSFPLVAKDAALVNQRVELLWIPCGTKDFLYDRNVRFTTWLKERGVEHVFHETGGGHDWTLWRGDYLPKFVRKVFRSEG